VRSRAAPRRGLSGCDARASTRARIASLVCASIGTVARRAVLRRTEFDVQQAQEVINLSQCRDRALAPAARGALFDRHRRRQAEDRVHVRPRGRLHQRAGVSIERFEIAALAFIEKNIEAERLCRCRQTPVMNGQRRYLESLNAYARSLVQPASRPDVDAIFGLPRRCDRTAHLARRAQEHGSRH